MGQTTTLTCNCGCGESTSLPKPEGWFQLSQAGYDVKNTEAKLDGELHFKDFGCLRRWTNKVGRELPKVQKQAEAFGHRRGTFRLKEPLAVFV